MMTGRSVAIGLLALVTIGEGRAWAAEPAQALTVPAAVAPGADPARLLLAAVETEEPQEAAATKPESADRIEGSAPPPEKGLSFPVNENFDLPGSTEAEVAEVYDPERVAPTGPRPVFPGLVYPGRAGSEGWRQSLDEKHGLRLAASYQQLYQHANNTLPIADNASALGFWWSFDVIWAAVNRGTDREGRLVLRVAQRDPIGNNTAPSAFGLATVGSAWSNYEFTFWDGVRVEDIFWEQEVGPDFNFRVGNLIAASVYNFSRFKDARTSFTASPFAFHEIIPIPTYGFGASVRWSPGNSGIYVVGTLNDMNGEPNGNGLDWSTVANGQFFYGLEIGKRWRRADGSFDHLHVNFYYASERSTRSADIAPNEAGWGVRVYGEKQWDRLVLFGGYTYNTAVGGGIATTVQEQVGTIGLARLHPFNIRGEAAIGFMVAKPLDDLIPIPGFNPRTQYGFEPYWRIQLTPGLSLTPGTQVIFNPSFNLNVNTVVVPHIKFRFVL